MEYIFKDPNKLEDFYFLTKGMEKTKCKHDGPIAQEVIANYCYDKIIEKYGSVIPVTTKYTSLYEFGSMIDDRNMFHPVYSYNEWFQKEIPNDYYPFKK